MMACMRLLLFHLCISLRLLALLLLRQRRIERRDQRQLRSAAQSCAELRSAAQCCAVLRRSRIALSSGSVRPVCLAKRV
jgi:hypothetical protein